MAFDCKNNKTMRRLFILVSAALFGVQAVWAQSPEAAMLQQIYNQTTIAKEGSVAPNFRASRYAGGRVSLEELRGKVVLLTFWASWCGPCLKELSPDGLPTEILAKYGDNPDFVFLPVATDTVSNLDEFFSTPRGKNYLYLRDITLLDGTSTILHKYATQGIPRSFVIDRNGKVVCGSMSAADEEIQKVADAVGRELEVN